MLNYSAEDIFGPVSAEVGLYLMELADFLEECGRLEESQVMVSRYHSILLKLKLKAVSLEVINLVQRTISLKAIRAKPLFLRKMSNAGRLRLFKVSFRKSLLSQSLLLWL